MVGGARADEILRVAGVLFLAEAAPPPPRAGVHPAEGAGVGRAEGAQDGLPRDAGGRRLQLREGREERPRGQPQAPGCRVSSLFFVRVYTRRPAGRTYIRSSWQPIERGAGGVENIYVV